MNRVISVSFSLLILFFVTGALPLIAQHKYPQNNFIAPLDIPLHLSGTFGELRSDHFHSGIDLRTGEVEGLKVYAIAEGYVSRIKVSAGGYGKALYITHPNGFVSVYAHLQQYSEKIKEYVTNEQYRLESFEVDLYPAAGTLVVKQGEIIALSGDSGGSGGPHLHFEIRDAGSEKPINPILFGFKIEDQNPPIINLLKIYPADGKCLIRNKNKELEIALQGSNGKYSPSGNDTVTISGRAYFGINTIDLFNNGNNKNGVYSIRLMLDSILVYQQVMETFSFDETRYINSLLDYPERIKNNRWIQKSYLQPNNHLSIYNKVINKGVIDFNDENIHFLVYQVSDAAGNISSINFWIKSKTAETMQESIGSSPAENVTIFTYKSDNLFEAENIRFEIPGNALYDTMMFTYMLLPGIKNSWSGVHQLHQPTEPLHTKCNLSIRADSLPKQLQSKALIVRIDEQQKIISSGGEWDNGSIFTQVREFGKYCVMVDTIAPNIIPVNISNGKNIAQQSSIKIKITDELAGISSYRGSLNGQWILMDYDAKNDLLTYLYDNMLLKGENIFELKVSDKKNNTSVYKAKLIY